MSRRYRGVGGKCLRGEFGDGDVVETPESSSDDLELHSRRWLETSLAGALESLDRISFQVLYAHCVDHPDTENYWNVMTHWW